MIELPRDVAAALEAAAAERGVSAGELAAQVLGERFGGSARSNGLDGFFGCMDSGDPQWASTDTKVLRKAAARAG